MSVLGNETFAHRKRGLVLPVRGLCQLEETPADLPGSKCHSSGLGLCLTLGGGVGDGRRNHLC